MEKILKDYEKKCLNRLRVILNENVERKEKALEVIKENNELKEEMDEIAERNKDLETNIVLE